MKNLAPIILFTYNRIHQTKKTIAALQTNELASESELFIYSDGAKNNTDQLKIKELRIFLKSISTFKKVTIIEQEKNLGLAKSIVKGVTHITNKFGKAIVLEDDIVTSPFFLLFMNEALDMYRDDQSVMHISGYMYPNKNMLPDTFFFNVPLCWGWATWKRAWDFYNDNVNDHINFLDYNNLWSTFNKFGGKYLERQLRKNKSGKMNTWFIFWHATLFKNNGFSLYPGVSLVDNIGFDKSGQHKASTNKFYSHLATEKVIVNRIKLQENDDAIKTIRHFYKIRRNSYLRKIIRIISNLIKK